MVGHFIAAALHYFKMDNTNAVPVSDVLSRIEHSKNIKAKKKLFHVLMANFVKTYINITPFNRQQHKDNDQVRAYAKEVLSLGAVLMEFNDAVREGDGERLLRT